MNTPIRFRTGMPVIDSLTRSFPHSLSQPAPPAAPATDTKLDTLRKAILRSAAEAHVAEPTDTDARLHSFVARLSANMEFAGERDLDVTLWNLLCTVRPQGDQSQLSPASTAGQAEQAGAAAQ